MLNPRDDTGRKLDASFTLEKLPDGFALTVESRGGSDHGPNPSRNKNYVEGMLLHLKRMAEHDMRLDEIQVASAKALRLSGSERIVWPEGYPRPLSMAAVSDFNDLRLAIGRQSAAFQNTSNSTGNNSKRMKLIVRSPEAANMAIDQLEAIFTGLNGASVWTEAPASNEEELRERVANARRKARRSSAKGKTPPEGQNDVKRVSGSSEHFVRDPNVIAWVLEQAAGSCEACSEKAPFRRDDAEPYLEVHHVRPLAEGGPDTVDNAVACCPNCHRHLHYGSGREKFRQSLLERVGRLKDWPQKPIA
ncbi:HNH endonuclease [Oceanibacterium hippocampi]|uniref:HNH endonuclease n=1 Tax=Oceanibacterium hippocampi TaxID=745714 RepID=A0A1Y5U030_9PROT|nr:HNH endonuclease signature motif containing protein [Oceanibacterium hippocampi]SLN77678.1 HNH endonuclease [Oceanibacterium hippocampi]